MKVSTFRNNHGDPPKINVNLPEISEVTQNSKRWKDVQLPIDILLLTVKDCEFLSCYYYINDPFRSYFKGLGPVYFGSIGEDQDVKLNVALMKCLKCSRVPGGALAVVNTAVIQLRPKAVFSVGHCSGMNQESTKLGDVVVSEKLTTYSYQKVTKEGKRFCWFTTPVSRDIAELIKSTAYSWNPPLENPRKRKVEVHCGEVLNGSELVQAEWQRDELMKSFPEAIAIETEGEGKISFSFEATVTVKSAQRDIWIYMYPGTVSSQVANADGFLEKLDQGSLDHRITGSRIKDQGSVQNDSHKLNKLIGVIDCSSR